MIAINYLFTKSNSPNYRGSRAVCYTISDMTQKIKQLALRGSLFLVVFSTVLNESVFAQDLDPATVGTPPTGGSVYDWLSMIINVLSVVALSLFVLSMIIAGYQYMTARDNAQQVSDAKNRITTTVISIILFVFGYAFLQWLIPGGVF